MVRQVQGPLRRRLGRAPRGDLRPPEGARGHPRRCRAHRPPRRDPRLRRHARRAQARARPPDGGLRRVPRAHRPPRRPAHRRPRGPGGPRRHARLLHHRRQRRVSAEGTDQRHASTRCSCLNGAAGSRDPRVHGLPHRRLRHARRPTTTTPSAGPTPCARPTSGPSRSPRTGAAPATAPSCTGPTASRPRARSATSSTTSSTSPPPCSTPPASPRPTFVNGIQQKPLHGVSMALHASTTPTAAERRETQYFEMFCNRGIYHQGWTAVTRHTHTVGHGAPTARASTTTCWELYDTNTDWTQAHDLAAEHPDKLARAAAALPHRGHQVQRAAARRPPRRAVQLRPRRPPDPRPREHPSCSSAAWAASRENSVLNLKNKSHSVTAEIEVPDGGANGVIIAQGGAFAGWSLYLARRQPHVLPQPARAGPVQVVAGTEPVPAGTHQVRMEFAYDGGGLAKGGDVAALRRRRPRSARVGSMPPSRWSTPPTRPATSVRTPARRSATTTRRPTSRFTGTVHWVQLDIDEAADDLDHLIDPEERLRVVMARQ